MQKNTIFLQNKKKGSFLVDVLVSLVILMMGIGASYTVVNQSIISNSINKNKIIAINLAREGMEAINLVRGTNWLRYGTKKRICWNFWNNTNEDQEWNNSSDDTCSESPAGSGQNGHPIGLTNGGVKIKNYLAVLDTTNYDWTLVENFTSIIDGTLNTNDTCKAITGLTSGDDCFSSDGGKWLDRKNSVGSITSRLYKDASTGLYTHDSGTGNTPTDFYREISLEYSLTSDGFFPANQSKDNQINVTIVVWYKGHGGIFKNIVLETEITDYLERVNWLD